MATTAKAIIEEREGYHLFTLYAANQHAILFSRLFCSKRLCHEGIEILIKNVAHANAINVELPVNLNKMFNYHTG